MGDAAARQQRQGDQPQTRRLVEDLVASLDAGAPTSQPHNLPAGTATARSADRNAELAR